MTLVCSTNQKEARDKLVGKVIITWDLRNLGLMIEVLRAGT